MKNINSKIYRSLLKNGYSNFKLEILEYCDTFDIVIQREQYYIDLIEPEYNILRKAGSLRGFKHSEITKKLLSEISMKNKTWVENFAELGESTNVLNRSTGETHNFNSNLKAAKFIGKDAYTLYVIIKRKNFYLNKEYLVYKSSTSFEEIINSNAYKEAISLSPASQEVEEVSKYYRHTLSAKEAISKNNSKSKAVVLTKIETNETLEFNTMKDAASFLGLNKNGVRNHINNNKPCNGYSIAIK